jgi:membrane associated rhomboid family serine protease
LLIPLKDDARPGNLPTVTLSLIAVNALVWFWEVSGTPVERDVVEWAYYPCAVSGPCVPPIPELPTPDPQPLVLILFSSMFMHAGWLHIIGNMLFLWIFGNNVENSMGKLRFLVFYLLAGLSATAAQTFVTLQFGTPAEASIPNIGASGAVAGVLGAYFVLLPIARITTFIFLGIIFFIRRIPAMFFLGFWFLFQLWQGGSAVTHPQEGGGVAFFAHIGGFVFGMAAISAFAIRRPARPTAYSG